MDGSLFLISEANYLIYKMSHQFFLKKNVVDVVKGVKEMWLGFDVCGPTYGTVS